MLSHHLRKYFIMGSQNCERDPEEILTEAIHAGITAFQFREKGNGSLTGNAKIELGEKLRKICKQHQIPFYINDDIELADMLNVDGIHVGQSDTPVEKIRAKYPDLYIGLSISNKTELKNSPLHLVNYIGAGPVYATNTKEDAKQAVGTEWITYLRKQYPNIPIVGIGGIDTTNAQHVLKAGANGVAFISVVTRSKHIKHTVKDL